MAKSPRKKTKSDTTSDSSSKTTSKPGDRKARSAKTPRSTSRTSKQTSNQPASQMASQASSQPKIVESSRIEIIHPGESNADDVESGALGSEEFGPEGFAPAVNEDEAYSSDSDLESDLDSELAPDHELLDEVPATRSVTPEIIESESKSKSKALAPSADPVATYLAEIRRYPLLTKEQERELAIRYRETGDAAAAELLVTSNLRFVVKIAAEYSRFGAKLIDLIQEGNVGLMHAVKEFNPYKGVRLITYAVWWIRGYIQEYLMRQYSLVRIGTTQNQRKLFYRLQKEREALDAAGREPNYALLAGRLGVTEEEVETMTKRLSGRDLSLNQPLDASGSSTASLLDYEPSLEEGVDERLGQLEEIEVLRRNLEKIRPGLSEKELYILEKRILADEPLTLQEIGEHYGVTREAVRQLEARLIGKIRAAVTESLESHPIEDDEDSEDDSDEHR